MTQNNLNLNNNIFSRFSFLMFGCGLGFVILIITISSSIYTVETGETALVRKLGKLSDQPKEDGLHFKTPFITQAIKINTKQRVFDSPSMSSAFANGQQVGVDSAIQYKINKDQAYDYLSNIGSEASLNQILSNIQQDAVKASTAKYSLEKALSNREELGNLISQNIQENINAANLPITVKAITIQNLDFGAKVRESIERKTTAQQEAEAAQFAKQKAQELADAEIITAKGKAEADRIRAEALKQNQQLLELKALEVQEKAINKWNGQTPTTVLGDSVPFILNPNN